MKINSFAPRNQLLSRLIQTIYIIEQDGANECGSFLILPSVSTYLSISQNTKSFLRNEVVIVEACEENLLDSSVQFGLKSSTVYEYQGKIKEICILFKPLAIFDFFDEEFLLGANKNDQLFIPDKDFERRIIEILSFADNQEIIDEIERYLLPKYSPFQHKYLHKAIADLENTDSENHLSIEEIAEKYQVSRQTINHQCKKYLNLSASEFRQICRFRKFIQAKLIDENNSKLTDFVYEFGFFDQSHLIKEFRKYTFLKPNDFFRKIDHSKDNSILVIWQ